MSFCLLLEDTEDLSGSLQAINLDKPGPQGNAMHQPSLDIFMRLASDMDTEGRYLFLNALANQLRYPNNHTHYFSCILLYLFNETPQVSSLTDTPYCLQGSCLLAITNDVAKCYCVHCTVSAEDCLWFSLAANTAKVCSCRRLSRSRSPVCCWSD